MSEGSLVQIGLALFTVFVGVQAYMLRTLQSASAGLQTLFARMERSEERFREHEKDQDNRHNDHDRRMVTLETVLAVRLQQAQVGDQVFPQATPHIRRTTKTETEVDHHDEETR